MMLLIGFFGLGALIIFIISFFGFTLLFGHLFIIESRVKTMEREEVLNPKPKSDLQVLTEVTNSFFTDFGNFQNSFNYRVSKNIKTN
jgi:hypothetical protein